jgi:DnaJ-class molecular chaperone
MKSLFDQNHYEILELSRDAQAEQVEQAFRMAEATYADDSLAGYSVFGEGEAQVIRERVATAFRVLSDPEARAAYDAELDTIVSDSVESSNETSAFDDPLESISESIALRPEMDHGDVDEFSEFEEDAGEFDGARLRRSRLRRGV